MLPHPQCSQHPAHTSKYVGAYDGLELSLGSYKFLATVDDCKNTKFPRTFAFIFMTDVSYNGTRSGPVRLLCEQLKVLLRLSAYGGWAEESAIPIGFVTCTKVLHLYHAESSLAQLQMMVVSDVDNMLDGFLVNVNESWAVITAYWIRFQKNLQTQGRQRQYLLQLSRPEWRL